MTHCMEGVGFLLRNLLNPWLLFRYSSGISVLPIYRLMDFKFVCFEIQSECFLSTSIFCDTAS